MPFIVYKDDRTNLIRGKEVSLAGTRGPIYALARHKTKGYKETDAVEWEITEEELIEKLGFGEKEYKLIIDLKPKIKNNVSLYYLKKIFGYSYSSWTPVALQLETIFSDKKVEDAESFKENFPIPEKKGDIVHEFLYLRGGFEEGNWAWGRVGSVNGCLLWPDAFKFFVDKISPCIR